jgi:hypothetical protein
VISFVMLLIINIAQRRSGGARRPD